MEQDLMRRLRLADFEANQRRTLIGHYILEIESEDLWRKFGFASLYEYCEFEYGYSEAEVEQAIHLALQDLKDQEQA